MMRRILFVLSLVIAMTGQVTSSASASHVTGYFGSGPYALLWDAAGRYGSDANRCGLKQGQLVALAMATSWHEMAGNNVTLLPPPLGLSRWDKDLIFRKSSSYPRAWYHPGTGYSQLDDANDTFDDMGIERFSGVHYARFLVRYIKNEVCTRGINRYIYRAWNGCHRQETIGIRCFETYKAIYHLETDTLHITRRTMSNNGGAVSRVCSRPSRRWEFFPCLLIDSNKTEGHRGGFMTEWDPSQNWGTTKLSPLSLPFYIYTSVDPATGVKYEMRTWLNENTGYDRHVTVRRQLGRKSRIQGVLGWSHYGVCLRMYDPAEGYYPSCPS